MRIVYVTRSFPYEKKETFLIPELRFLKKEGHEILIFPCGEAKRVINRDAEQFLDSTRVIITKRASTIAALFKNFFIHPLICLRFLAFMLGSKSYHRFVTRARIFVKATVASEIVKKWEADHIHAYSSSEPATMALYISKFTGIPFSFTAHRFDILENEILSTKLKKTLFVRFVSEDAVNLFREVTGIEPGDKGKVIHLGVEVPGYNQIDKKEDGKVILCPANLLRVKGHVYLIQAMLILKKKGIDFELWLAGDGPLRESLEEFVDHLHVRDCVKFLGYVPHNELLKFYEGNKVLMVVIASVDLGKGEREGGLSIALMEAMSYGVPVVATRVGGIPELLTEDTGILVKDKDPKALAEAIERIFKDKQLRMSLGKAARARIEKHFSVEKNASYLLELFKSNSFQVS